MNTRDRWKEISWIYSEGLSRTGNDRTTFVRDACAGDEPLRLEVESLLAAHADAEQFMTSPAATIVANAMARENFSLVGQRLGAYRLEARLGAGGMGEVYKATDTRLERTVAIKILPRHLGGDEQLRQRFEHEARAVAALRHPHICVLHDVGEHDGTAFLVMEYIEGETMAQRLANGPLPLEQACRLAVDIADALVDMHAHGVVHLDLKPGNIMLTASGAKLLDFGLATRQAPVAGRDDDPPGGVVPALKTIAGTLAYMAPEQRERKDLDHRTDIFAFGAVLYEMVTGRKVYDDRLVRNLPSQPAAIRLDRRVEPLIRKCLSEDPNDRFQQTPELADALRRIERSIHAAMPKPSVSQSWRRWWPVPVFVPIALLLLWWAGALDEIARAGSGFEIAEEARRVEPLLAVGNIRPLPAAHDLEIDPSISPDGRFVAYSAGTVARRRIFIRPIGGGSATAIADDGSILQFQPRWSPDGRRLLYVTPEGAFVVPVAGGSPRRLTPVGERGRADSSLTFLMASGFTVHGAAWSPDGTSVAIAAGGSLSIVPAAGGEPRQVVEKYGSILHSCDWSPNGNWIACVSGNWAGSFFGNASPSAVVLVPAAGGEVIDVTGDTALHQSPVWSPDSRQLFFVSNRQGTNDIYTVEISVDGGVRGEPLRATTGLGAFSIAYALGHNRLVYAAYSARSNIWSLPIPSAGPVDSSRAEPVTTGAQAIEVMRVSHDGKWLLYDSNLRGNSDIFRIPIAGGQAEPLTSDSAEEFAPDLSPDGQLVAYHSWRTKSRDIFVQPLNGGPPEQVTATASQESFPRWTPDGRALLFYDLSVEDGAFRGPFIVRRREAGGWQVPEPLRAGAEPCRPPVPCQLSSSRDGSFLVYARGGAIGIVSADGATSRTVYTPSAASRHPNAESVLVSDDGRTLYFKSHDSNGRASLWSMPRSGGAPAALVRFDDPSRPSNRPDFAVAGNRFYFTIDERRSSIWVADVTGR